MMRRLAVVWAITLCLSGWAAALECTTPDRRTGVGVMQLKPNARLFASGNFHTQTPGGKKKPDERDLVYVSSRGSPSGDHRYVLTTLLTRSNGCFDPPMISDDVNLGKNPSLIVVGNFNDDTKGDDVVIIDTPDPLNPAPFLRIFLGDGKGNFKEGSGVSMLALKRGERPVSMVAGRFRGPSSPIDIAIASIPKDPGSPSVLWVLVNNGQGEFRKSSEPAHTFLPDFKPGLMLADDRFRPQAKYDIVIREEAGPSLRPAKLLYLRNSGDGNFHDVIPLESAGNINSLLVGVLSNKDTGGDKLDIITFDDDMRLKIFVNDGKGLEFTLRSPDNPDLNPHVGKYTFGTTYLTGLKQFLVIEPGSRPVRLAAFVTQARDGKQGILDLTADNSGGFKPKFGEVPTDVLRIPAETMPTREAIWGSDPRIHGPEKLLGPENGFVGAFLTGGGSALGLVARQLERVTTAGPCPQSSEMSALMDKPVCPPWCGDDPFPGPICDPPLSCKQGSYSLCIKLPPVGDTCRCRCSDDREACMLTKTVPAVRDPPVLIVFSKELRR